MATRPRLESDIIDPRTKRPGPADKDGTDRSPGGRSSGVLLFAQSGRSMDFNFSTRGLKAPFYG